MTGYLPDENHYVVDVLVSEKGDKKLVNVLVDGDEGVTIQTCAKLSRALSAEIETLEIIDEAYILEVSSPGVDYPLQGMRQYQKNVGRDLLIHLTDGAEVLGTLLSVDEQGVTVNAKEKAKGKSKKINTTEKQILFADIIKSIVQVSFK